MGKMMEALERGKRFYPEQLDDQRRDEKAGCVIRTIAAGLFGKWVKSAASIPYSAVREAFPCLNQEYALPYPRRVYDDDPTREGMFIAFVLNDRMGWSRERIVAWFEENYVEPSPVEPVEVVEPEAVLV